MSDARVLAELMGWKETVNISGTDCWGNKNDL